VVLVERGFSIFIINDKIYAIEVETGKAFHDKNKFMKKVRLLNKTYGKNWFFVVTDRNLVKSYSKYGETCDVRYVPGRIRKIAKSSR